MGAGAELPVNKGWHMVVCKKWMRQCIKPGGTAGITPVPAILYSRDSFFVSRGKDEKNDDGENSLQDFFDGG